MRFIVFVVVLLVVVRFITMMVGGKRASTTQGSTSSTPGQPRAFVARLRHAAAAQRAQIQSRIGTGFRSPPTYPAARPTPAAPAAAAPPPSAQPALDEQLASPAASTKANTSATGPRLVPLTPELEQQAKRLMSQGYEVMAVRLLCDELGVGILDAQKTVRTLVGLPTPY